MAKVPTIRDWKASLQNEVIKSSHSEEETLRIIHTCMDYLGEIQPLTQWLNQQQSFVTQIYSSSTIEYAALFNKQPPPRPTETPTKEILLETPERRRQVIREVALSMTKPGDDVSDKGVLEELKRRGMKLDATNPAATVSTILYGYKPHFVKVDKKRGVFKRQE